MAVASLSRNANRLRCCAHRYFDNFHSFAQSGPSILSSSSASLPEIRTLFSLDQRVVKSYDVFGKFQYYPNQRWSFSTATNNTSPSTESDVNTTIKESKNSKTKPQEEEGEKSGGTEAGRPVRGGPVSWMSFLLLLATGIGLILYYDREKKRHIEVINKASLAVKEGPSVGKAAIGGPFNLIDHTGKLVTEKDFIGKWTLIYFGFTHCPDVCPAELEKLAAAVDKIKKEVDLEIVPVFISVDPERDSVEQVREYVKEYHPKFVGLTGSPEEIKKTARAYRVYYMKTAEDDSDYLVDHSIVMYLMGPDMGFVKFFGKNNDVDSLAAGVIKEIKQYKSNK